MFHFQQLILSKNNIEKIDPNTFGTNSNGGCCSNLRVLDLASNNLQTLSADIFVGTPQLQTLLLADNNFRQIPSTAIEPLAHLTRFDLSGNIELKVVTDAAFIRNTKLRELILRGCSLSTIGYNGFQSLGKRLCMSYLDD